MLARIDAYGSSRRTHGFRLSLVRAAEWRWNGYDWYAADAVTHKRHVCMTPEAVADRTEREARAADGPVRRAFGKLRR